MTYITEQDLISRRIELGGEISNSEALKTLVKDDQLSAYKAAMSDGINYYKCNHTYINDEVDFDKYNTRQQSGTDSDGKPTYTTTITTDPNSPNIKKINPFFREILTQKVDYGFSNGVIYDLEDETAKANIEEVVGKSFDSIMSEWVTSAGTSAIGWVYFYIDNSGKLGYKVLDSREIIPVYEDDTETILQQVIRYYYVTEIIDDNKSNQLIIEIYDGSKKEVYKDSQGILSLTSTEYLTAFGVINPDGTEEEILTDWGRPPFVQLLNNSERITDLQPIKSLVDDYDYQDSKLSNDYATLQEALLAIRGYEGENPAELLEYIRVIKAVMLSSDDNSGVEAVETTIPYEGKTSILERTSKNIYKYARSVDGSTETVSKASSGVALEIMYKPLESKAQRSYQQLSKSLYGFFWFVNRYFELTQGLSVKTIPVFDVDSMVFTFTPDRVINLLEISTIVVNLSALLPKRELYKLLPFIDQNNIDKIIAESEAETEDIFKNEPPTEDDDDE